MLLDAESKAVTIQDLSLVYQLSYRAGFPDIATRAIGKMLDGNFGPKEWQEIRSLFPVAESKLGRIALAMIQKKAVSQDQKISAFLYLDTKLDSEAEAKMLVQILDQVQ